MVRAVNNSVFLAWRYLRYHKLRSVIIILALSLVMFVPVLIELMIVSTQSQFTERSEGTPLILGAQGSALDLTINSLHFVGKRPKDIKLSALKKIDKTKLAYSIPLYTRFKARGHQIIGTDDNYFSFRKLQFNQGKLFEGVGEVVIGGSLAKNENLKLTDELTSSSENLFDLSGAYPLKLKIVGILKETGTADDNVIFVNMQSSWVMAGVGHQHEYQHKPSEKNIRQDKRNQFHFHGEQKTFPVTSAIVGPNDHKALSILLGRYEKKPKGLQLIQPKKSIQMLFDTIFRVKKIFYSIIVTVSLSTLLTILLAFILSIKLREKEINTIYRMGCSRGAITGFIAAEIIIIVLASMLLSSGLVLLTQQFLDGIMVMFNF